MVLKPITPAEAMSYQISCLPKDLLYCLNCAIQDNFDGVKSSVSIDSLGVTSQEIIKLLPVIKEMYIQSGWKTVGLNPNGTINFSMTEWS